VAEGVGTQAQLDFLTARDCHYFQGYFASRPIAGAEFEEFLAAAAENQIG
jgi:EAL domain-containing protein (putative c-di-GMP-specific phosphodiesterase class I)